MLEKLFYKQLDIQGQYISLNDKTIKAIIHKVDSSESVPKGTIMTEEELKNGDILTIDNKKYMIVDTYKPTNKCYYTGEYMMANLIYFTSNTDFTGIPTENNSTYGAIYKLGDNVENSSLISVTNERYTVAINKNVVGLNFNSGVFSTCGTTYLIKTVDKTKSNLYYYNVEFKEYYNIDNYNFILLRDNIKLNSTFNTYQITYEIYKNDELITDNLTYEYNNRLISISDSGLITIKDTENISECSIIIKCIYKEQEKEFKLDITNEDIYDVHISPNNTILKDGKTYQLNPICSLNGVVIENPTITYSCDNSNVDITEDGLITVTSTDEQQTCKIFITYENVTTVFDLTIEKMIPKEYEVTSEDSGWRDKYCLQDNVDYEVYKNKSFIFKIVEKDTDILCLDKYDIYCYTSADNPAPAVNVFQDPDNTNTPGWRDDYYKYNGESEILVTDNGDGTFTVSNKSTRTFKMLLIKLTSTKDGSVLYVKVERGR